MTVDFIKTISNDIRYVQSHPQEDQRLIDIRVESIALRVIGALVVFIAGCFLIGAVVAGSPFIALLTLPFLAIGHDLVQIGSHKRDELSVVEGFGNDPVRYIKGTVNAFIRAWNNPEADDRFYEGTILIGPIREVFKNRPTRFE